MLSLIISTIVFFIATWYLRRYLDDQGIPKGMTRGMLVFVFAALLSWGSGSLLNWIQSKFGNPQTVVQHTDAMSKFIGLPKQ